MPSCPKGKVAVEHHLNGVLVVYPQGEDNLTLEWDLSILIENTIHLPEKNAGSG